jgi:hypothetical protein
MADKQQELINKKLWDLIHVQISKSYTQGAKITEGLGVLVSKFLGWDGVRISKAFIEALEDANYHTEALLVERIFDKYNGS